MQLINKMRKSPKRDYVEAVSQFFIKASGAHLSLIDVEIESVGGFEKETGATAGTCFDHSVDRIRVAFDSKLNKREILIALSHEFVHVRQHAFGELYYVDDRPHWYGEDCSNMAYEDQPWELDAYEEMMELLRKVPMVKRTSILAS